MREQNVSAADFGVFAAPPDNALFDKYFVILQK
jgi:hypothetical protein